MKEVMYHRANVNTCHDLVKAKVLVLLRHTDAWYTTKELATLCKFKSDGTMRSHCGVWTKKHIDKHGHSHNGILIRQARVRATARLVWEYHISQRGIRWLKWNIDRVGLQGIIMDQLGLIPKEDSTIEDTPTTINNDLLIEAAIKEVLSKYHNTREDRQ